MKKSHKEMSRKERAQQGYAERAQRRKRRWMIRIAVALAVVLPLGAVGFWQYEQRAAERRDLSVIGNGVPTLVQVYDRGCSECRSLRSKAQRATRTFGDQVQFRLADRSTGDGALLASSEGVGHLTLLYYSSDGRLLHTQGDPESADRIREQLRANFAGLD